MVSVPGNTGTPQWLKGNIPGSTEDHRFIPECLLAATRLSACGLIPSNVLIY